MTDRWNRFVADAPVTVLEKPTASDAPPSERMTLTEPVQVVRKPNKVTAAGARAKASPPEQLELPIAAALGYDPRAILDELNSAVDGFRGLWPSLAEPMVAGLITDIGAALADGVGGLALLAVGAGAVAALSTALGRAMFTLAGRAAKRAAGEVSALGVNVSAGRADEGALLGRAEVTAGLVAQTLAGSAARAALRHTGLDPDAVMAAVRADLNGLVELKPGGYILQSLAAALAAAQGSGRMATFAQVEEKIQLRASEVNDTARCVPCASVDGRVFDTFKQAAESYPAGWHVGCLGGDRCRGHLQPVART